MKRPTSDGSNGRSSGQLAGGSFGRLYPTLLEWMETDHWDDGSVRATTTLFLFVDGGLLKCMMKDRDSSKVAFLSSDTLEGLLEGLERGLVEGSTQWKADRPPAGRCRK